MSLVLGLDPGSVRLGYGLISTDGAAVECIEAGTISAPASKPIGTRLAEIGADLEALLLEQMPDVVALEHGFVAVIRGSVQQGALISSEARGVARFLAARSGIEIVELAPTAIKKGVTGSGRADKPTVARMVQRLLGLKRRPDPDASDALAAAIVASRIWKPRAR
ncbi:MAG TPA: crossover junction endodeoxyribonuclease RuvC [Candidatus Eisenbacteria bacterium]|nr:crossover junction endodeoxyribonuclease RuvC [Candidatus Eisenbacteria bacterium]